MNDKSALDSDFKILVGNANIEFFLLDTIFQSSATKGINRISSSLKPDRNKLLINPINCVNIYVADQGNFSNILSDRINLNFRDIGLHTHVLTHEMGHWLGLYHIWGKVGSCNHFRAILSSKDDGIDDTPKQFKCTDLSFSKTCPPKKNLYYKGHKILYNNFMDYSGCRCMFTVGQTIKMRNNIIESKPLLFDQ
ncbi:M43 family zinc metalloprotease [Tenacibaculum adriaticum]|uniref:M43 family zinc metalloprotease n=1 Tax=Tenacibaculum adriaticum TaxID=413713 RepID=UPI00147901A2|nr:M43 family zinc metalloprotease [Tenacibaculum adriaticum]